MHWHRTLSFLVASPLVACAAVPVHALHEARELSSQAASIASSLSVPVGPNAGEAHLQVTCRAADEDFNLSFDVQEADDEPVAQSPCGSPRLLVNGQPLDHLWRLSESSPQGTGVLAIDAETLSPHSNHSLLLDAYTICPPESVQVTTLTIFEIDGTPTQALCGLAVSYDQHTRRIITVVPLAEDEQALSIMKGPIQPDSFTAEEKPLIKDEVRRLRTLEADLAELTSAVQRQQSLVDDLATSETHKTTQELSECDDIKCFVKTIAHKATGCIHILLLRYGPHQEADAFSKDHDCVWPDGRAARMQVLMSGKPLCLSPQDSDAGRQSAGEKSTHIKSSGDSITSSPSYTTSITLPEDLGKEHKLHIIIGAVLSFFCLSCFSVCLHRRCCDPRRRAERASRREERARRKEYRRLSRCKAWKDWWNVRILRNDSGASTDYEEKRSLILTQEAILERAMQSEIRVLRAAHTGVSDLASAAEEGRAYQSDGEDSLPAYRSRAGSGRPPSYNEVDVTGRVRAYVSSTSGDSVLRHYEAAARADDSTPDSSVANLSPRNSSETLRTERSAL